VNVFVVIAAGTFELCVDIEPEPPLELKVIVKVPAVGVAVTDEDAPLSPFALTAFK
jgi:hypothetical protein